MQAVLYKQHQLNLPLFIAHFNFCSWPEYSSYTIMLFTLTQGHIKLPPPPLIGNRHKLLGKKMKWERREGEGKWKERGRDQGRKGRGRGKKTLENQVEKWEDGRVRKEINLVATLYTPALTRLGNSPFSGTLLLCTGLKHRPNRGGRACRRTKNLQSSSVSICSLSFSPFCALLNDVSKCYQ